MKTCIVSLLSSALLVASTAGTAAPANDDFENSERVEGADITYSGTFTSATLQPGEPVPGATNTIWMSWVAPARGAVWLTKASAPQWQYYAVYTGSRVDQLQPVTLVGHFNNICRFLADEGTVYYFQFSGGADTIVFNLQFDPLTSCPNDNWNNAHVLRGTSVYDDARSVGAATMELNEPAHMGNVAQKSIWWKWQAPFWGTYRVSPSASLVTNFVLAVYTGTAVEALTLVAKSTNQAVDFYMTGGETYYIAGAVPTNAFGDFFCDFHSGSAPETSVHTIPGNLLLEPSWENTALHPQYWQMSSPVGGYVNENGGVDGRTWPSLGAGRSIWQDVPTIPGHKYAITFAYRPGAYSSGNVQLAVSLGGALLGTSTIPAAEGDYWHWDTYTGTATDTTSRLLFQNLDRTVEMDAFSMVDASAPPTIVTQPASASSLEGGSVAFVVGLYGATPLSYQWFFNDLAIADQTNKVLTLNPVRKSQEGDYQVIITNNFGAITSAVASLRVDAPTTATILCQPYGDVVPVGGYYNFNVTAAGPPPLSYQWFMNGQPIAGATNSNLRFTEVQGSNDGVYQVQVKNNSSEAWSLPATLVVDSSAVGGGTFDFRNKSVGGPAVNAPVADIDGSTLLNSTNYVAQLYAGPSLELLRPAGVPTPFHYFLGAGYWTPKIVKLANVAPGSNAVMRVCVWDANYGSSYEQARATGGRFGKSNILILPASEIGIPPQPLLGLQSFCLQAGMPFFQVGTVSFVERQPGGTVVWALHGQAGSLYLIEKSKRTHDTVWHPYAVVTNVTGTVTFTDSADSGAANVWFRARILD